MLVVREVGIFNGNQRERESQLSTGRVRKYTQVDVCPGMFEKLKENHRGSREWGQEE